MLQPPFELRYSLTRRQRLIPHLKIWGRYAPLVIVCVAGAGAGVVYLSWWCLALLLGLLFLFRGFFVGFWYVVFVRRHVMDLVVEQNSLGILIGRARWYLPLDGLIGFDELKKGVWTMQHWNGSVINIPAELLNAEQIEFFRNWVIEADAIRRRLGITPPSAK